MAENRSFFQRRKRTLIVLGVVLVIALIVILNLRSQREKTVKVTVEKVKASDLTSIISASGRGQAQEKRRDQRPRPRPDHQDRSRRGRRGQGGRLPAEARLDPVRGQRRGEPGRHPVLHGPAHPGRGPAARKTRTPTSARTGSLTNSSSPRTSWKRPSPVRRFDRPGPGDQVPDPAGRGLPQEHHGQPEQDDLRLADRRHDHQPPGRGRRDGHHRDHEQSRARSS